MEDIETVDAPEGYSWTLSPVGWGTGANFYQLKLKRWGLLTVATESFFSDGLRGPATEDEFRRQTANAARKILRGMETKRSWARNIERALNAGRERG